MSRATKNWITNLSQPSTDVYMSLRAPVSLNLTRFFIVYNFFIILGLNVQKNIHFVGHFMTNFDERFRMSSWKIRKDA